MELKIRVANPAGNVTIFVMGPQEDMHNVRDFCAHGKLHRETRGFVEDHEMKTPYAK